MKWTIGLDEVDRKILLTMIEKFAVDPWVWTPCRLNREETITIEDVYEPYLLQLGFIARTLEVGSLRP